MRVCGTAATGMTNTQRTQTITKAFRVCVRSLSKRYFTRTRLSVFIGHFILALMRDSTSTCYRSWNKSRRVFMCERTIMTSQKCTIPFRRRTIEFCDRAARPSPLGTEKCAYSLHSFGVHLHTQLFVFSAHFFAALHPHRLCHRTARAQRRTLDSRANAKVY